MARFEGTFGAPQSRTALALREARIEFYTSCFSDGLWEILINLCVTKYVLHEDPGHFETFVMRSICDIKIRLHLLSDVLLQQETWPRNNENLANSKLSALTLRITKITNKQPYRPLNVTVCWHVTPSFPCRSLLTFRRNLLSPLAPEPRTISEMI